MYFLKDVGLPDELKKNKSYVKFDSQKICMFLKKQINTYWDILKCLEALFVI